MLGQGAGSQIVGRTILQVARFVYGLGDDPASPTCGRRDRRRPSKIKLSRCLPLALPAQSAPASGLVSVEAIVGQQSSPARSPPRSPHRRAGSASRAPSSTSLWCAREQSPLATRARSAVKSSRAPSPTVNQRLPSTWVSPSDLKVPRASPLDSSSPTCAGVPAGAPSPSNTPIAMVSAADCAGWIGGPGDVHDPSTISRPGKHLLCRSSLSQTAGSIASAAPGWEKSKLGESPRCPRP